MTAMMTAKRLTDSRYDWRTWVLKSGFRISSPSGRNGRLSVLLYHRVHAQRDPLFPDEVDVERFRARMTFVRSFCNVLPLDDAVKCLKVGSLPERAVAITFDDGYADNVHCALPVLADLRLHATFFITTGFLDGGLMWNDTIIESIRAARTTTLDLTHVDLGIHTLGSDAHRRATIDKLLGAVKHKVPEERTRLVNAIREASDVALPRDLMMSGSEVRSLASAGMGIGAHTVTHPILARVDRTSGRNEIAGSRESLEAIVRQRVNLFAYPNGKPTEDYTRDHVELVRSLGFDAAFSTSAGAAGMGDSIFELPRYTPWDKAPLRFGARLIANLYTRTSRAV